MTRELLEAINIQAKREGFFWPVLRAIVFEQLAKKYPAKQLLEILKDYRGGSWGTDQQTGLLPASSLRSPDIRHGSIDFSQAETRYYTPSELEKHRLENGDILVIKSNGSLDLVGKSQLFLTTAAASPVTASNFVLILSPDRAQVDPTYLDWFLKSPQALVWRVDKQRTTTGLRNLDTDGYLASSVPLPPSKQIQKEIVEIFAAIGDGDWPENPHFDIRLAQRAKDVSDAFEKLGAEAEHQETLLAKLQQAILQEAIQGKLTADWRAAHPQAEPTRQLLHRIQAEKARLIAAKQLRPEKPLPKITPAEIPFAIPKTWEWCRLGNILSFSSGDGLTSAEMSGGKIPVFGGNGINGYHDKSNIEAVTIVVGRVGANCGAVHKTPARAWVTDNAFITTFSESCLDMDFLVLLLRFLDLNHLSYDGSQPVISGKRVYPLSTPLPPLAEQAAIVARVDSLLGSSRLLAAEIAHTRTHTAHLLQAVLKEAFTPAA